MKLNKNKILFLILLISLGLSLGYSFFYRIEPVVDAQAYDRIALNIIGGHGFAEDASKDPLFDHVITRAGPAYEYFLAFIYKLFGHYYEIVWLIQALLHTGTAYLIFLICQNIFSTRDAMPAIKQGLISEEKESGTVIGLIAAAIIGFHPDIIEISAMLMTETLYVFLVALAILCFVKIWKAPQNLLLHSAFGIILGATILSRPPVLLFLPIILVFYLLRKYYVQLILFMIFFVAVLAPWTIRNYTLYHQFIPTTLISEYNLWVGNTLRSTGGQISGGYNPATEYAEQFGYLSFKEAARDHFYAFIVTQPLAFAKLVLLRVIRYFSLIRPMGFWFYQSGLGQMLFVVFSLFSIGILFISGFSGLLQAFKQRKALWNYLIVFALTAPLALLPAVVESRYRFQIYPFLAIFGAYFLVSFWQKRSECIKSLIVAGSLLLVISFADLLTFWPVVWEHLRLFI